MSRRQPNYLFSTNSLSDELNAIERRIPQAVDEIPEAQFKEASDTQIIDHVEDRLKVEPITIFEDKASMDEREVQVDVSGDRRRYIRGPGACYIPGKEIKVFIPYAGNPNLWQMQPNSFFSVLPTGTVQGGSLTITVTLPHDAEKNAFKKEYDSNIDLTKKYLENQKKQIEPFNKSLRQKIDGAVKARRARLEKHSGLSELLGIPLRKRNGSPDIDKIKIERKIVKPLPQFKGQSSTPEPGITEQQYEDILSLIRHQGRTFEQLPKAFSVHDEEQLRDMILAALNAVYKGGATGETFRAAGKTDIRIEAKDRSAFIAENKIWHGSKKAQEAIEQLFSYTTWRDCKTAILMFNKGNADFTGLQETMQSAMRGHHLFLREEQYSQQGEWRYTFKDPTDSRKNITVHVFLFNIFTK